MMRDQTYLINAHRWQIVIVLFTLVFGIASCGSKVQVSDSELKTLSFSSLYDIALREALNWKSDAYLVQAKLPIWEGLADDSASVSFGFRSFSDRTHWLLVRVSLNGSDPSEVELIEGEYDSERPPASSRPIMEEIVSSQEALSIISNNGGADFVNRYGDDVDSYLLLKYSQDYYEDLPLVWVGHFHLGGQSPGLIIRIDAHTGEVIEKFDPTE